MRILDGDYIPEIATYSKAFITSYIKNALYIKTTASIVDTRLTYDPLSSRVSSLLVNLSHQAENVVPPIEF